jgi:hypothetical protein
MRFRKLRIAWSVVCGVVAVLLIVLWVRSYSTIDCLSKSMSGQEIALISINGHITLASFYGATHDRAISLSHAPVSHFAGYMGFVLNKASFKITLTHPISLLAVCLLAALPWPRWPKRFSLRTLLIATTLVAVVLGLIVYAASK